MRLILCDPAQMFAASLAPPLRERGHECHVVDAVPVPLDEPVVYVLDVADAALLSKLAEPDGPPTVLVITQRDDGFVLREAVDVGALGLISTEATVPELLTAVDQVVAGEPYYDPRLLRAALVGHIGMSDLEARRLAEQLTPGEHDVLTRIVRGDSTETMAADLTVSPATIRSHIQKVLTKLGVHSRLAAAAFALTHHLTHDPDR